MQQLKSLVLHIKEIFFFSLMIFIFVISELGMISWMHYVLNKWLSLLSCSGETVIFLGFLFWILNEIISEHSKIIHLHYKKDKEAYIMCQLCFHFCPYYTEKWCIEKLKFVAQVHTSNWWSQDLNLKLWIFKIHVLATKALCFLSIL